VIAHGLPIYVALEPVDMRMGSERLGALVRERMGAEPRARAPCSGSVCRPKHRFDRWPGACPRPRIPGGRVPPQTLRGRTRPVQPCPESRDTRGTHGTHRGPSDDKRVSRCSDTGRVPNTCPGVSKSEGSGHAVTCPHGILQRSLILMILPATARRSADSSTLIGRIPVPRCALMRSMADARSSR
jgi:hypothetical protein